jgi:hypothetical protein
MKTIRSEGMNWIQLATSWDNDESSVSIKCGQFLASQEEFCCLRLVKCRGCSILNIFPYNFVSYLWEGNLSETDFSDVTCWHKSQGETMGGSLNECPRILHEYDWLSKRWISIFKRAVSFQSGIGIFRHSMRCKLKCQSRFDARRYRGWHSWTPLYKSVCLKWNTDSCFHYNEIVDTVQKFLNACFYYDHSEDSRTSAFGSYTECLRLNICLDGIYRRRISCRYQILSTQFCVSGK